MKNKDLEAAAKELAKLGVTVSRAKGRPADTCRMNGWVVGDVLEGDEGYGPTRIRITAIGEDAILARQISHNGKARTEPELLWGLDARPWVRVSSAANE